MNDILMKSTLVYSLHYMITQHIHFDKKEYKITTESGEGLWTRCLELQHSDTLNHEVSLGMEGIVVQQKMERDWDHLRPR